MQKQFVQPGPVLDEKGSPYPGYSTKSRENGVKSLNVTLKEDCFNIKGIIEQPEI